MSSFGLVERSSRQSAEGGGCKEVVEIFATEATVTLAAPRTEAASRWKITRLPWRMTTGWPDIPIRATRSGANA